MKSHWPYIQTPNRERAKKKPLPLTSRSTTLRSSGSSKRDWDSIRFCGGTVLFLVALKECRSHLHVLSALCGLCLGLVAVQNDLLEACVLSSSSFNQHIV